MDSLYFTIPVAIFGIILIFLEAAQSNDISTRGSSKKYTKWIILLGVLVILITLAGGVVTDLNHDKEIASNDSSWRVQHELSRTIIRNQQQDSIGKEDKLRRDGIFFDSVLNKYFQADPVTAFVNAPTNQMTFEEANSDSFRISIRLHNTGPAVASNVEYELYALQKKGEQYIFKPGRIISNLGDGTNMPVGDYYRISISRLAPGGFGNSDTLLFYLKYRWNNPVKGINLPAHDYIFWNKQVGFNDVSTFTKLQIKRELKNIGIN